MQHFDGSELGGGGGRCWGRVKWFNCVKGYGFIADDATGSDLFVHASQIVTPNPHKQGHSLDEGEPVQFHMILDQRGRPQAVEVTGPHGACVRGSRYALSPMSDGGKEGGSLSRQRGIGSRSSFNDRTQGGSYGFVKRPSSFAAAEQQLLRPRGGFGGGGFRSSFSSFANTHHHQSPFDSKPKGPFQSAFATAHQNDVDFANRDEQGEEKVEREQTELWSEETQIEHCKTTAKGAWPSTTNGGDVFHGERAVGYVSPPTIKIDGNQNALDYQHRTTILKEETAEDVDVTTSATDEDSTSMADWHSIKSNAPEDTLFVFDSNPATDDNESPIDDKTDNTHSVIKHNTPVVRVVLERKKTTKELIPKSDTDGTPINNKWQEKEQKKEHGEKSLPSNCIETPKSDEREMIEGDAKRACGERVVVLCAVVDGTTEALPMYDAVEIAPPVFPDDEINHNNVDSSEDESNENIKCTIL